MSIHSLAELRGCRKELGNNRNGGQYSFEFVHL